MMRPRFLTFLALLAATGCDNAGENFGLPSLREGAVAIGVVLDRDGSGAINNADTVFVGARVALFIEGGVDTFRTALTDADGLAIFEELPIGRYTFAVVPGSVGDTLPVISNGSGSLRITANPDSLVAQETAIVGYATLTLTEARAASPGRRVFVRGIVSSPYQLWTDSATFLTGTANLRVTSSEHLPGRTGNNLGDSVIVFGTTGVDAGQPVLIDGLIQTAAERPSPAPTEITVAEARSARNGELDAALVRVSTATVGDTVSVGEYFHVEIASGADTVLVVYDPKLQAPEIAFVPGRSIQVRGMLVPVGDGTWFLKPRLVPGETNFP
jgi:hypothetical protein